MRNLIFFTLVSVFSLTYTFDMAFRWSINSKKYQYIEMDHVLVFIHSRLVFIVM